MKKQWLSPVAALALATQLAACSGDVVASSATDLRSPVAPSMDVLCGTGTFPLWSTSTIGENKPIEAEGTLTAGSGCGYYVMTGLGGRITADSNWTTVNLWGRRVYADGTMSAETRQDYGPYPGVAPEQEVHVPEGAVVVGVGTGEQNNNVSVIRLSYRYVTVVNGVLQLTGPIYTATQGTGNVEIEYVFNNDYEVYVGAGFGSSASNVTRMRWYSATLQ